MPASLPASPDPSFAASLARVVLPFGLAYLMQEVLRSVAATLVPVLDTEFRLGPEGLGLLGATYLVGFALAQLPNGVLLDRIGPRLLLPALLLVSALGCVAFSIATGAPGLMLARALTGFGMSACLMGAFAANAAAFPAHRLATVNGLVLGIGSVGSLAATKPVEAFLGVADWRALFLLLGGLVLTAGLTILLAVPRRPAVRRHRTPVLAELGEVLGSAAYWRIAPLVAMVFAVVVAYQGLWVAPWLRDVGGAPPGRVVDGLFAIAIGWIIGNLASGFLLDALVRRGWSGEQVLGLLMALFLAAQVALLLDGAAGLWLWPCIVLFGSTANLGYALLSTRVPSRLVGQANSMMNLLLFIFAFVVQVGIGRVIAAWPESGPGLYPAAAHRAALLILLLPQAASVLWFWTGRQRRVQPA
jgi:predicted MFS family arabinose efflux permease